MLNRRIAQVGLDGALFERDVTRTLERVSKAGGLTIHWPIPRTRDALGHSGVQPWSAGAIFPATIATVERKAATTYRVMVNYTMQSYVAYVNAYDDEEATALAMAQCVGAKRAYVLSKQESAASVSYRLTLDGHSEEYATWDDAERVALALLSDPRMRASWNADEDETMPNVDAYGVI